MDRETTRCAAGQDVARQEVSEVTLSAIRRQLTDRDVWKIIMTEVRAAAKELGWRGRKILYPTWLIVAMFIWCCWHDRPMSWASDRSHYTSLFRPRKLPSVSQFARRVKGEDVQRVLSRVHDRLGQRGMLTGEGYLDGKPLLVSSVSKDPDAKRGKIASGWGKGYKLHAYINNCKRIVVFNITRLPFDEKTAAREMLPYLPPMTADSAILGDHNYDAAPIHKALERLERSTHTPQPQLITPLKGTTRVGKSGRNPTTLRGMGSRRRELVEAWEQEPERLRKVLKLRITIERCFGTLTCTGGGLGTALPSWVRRLDRVRRWTGTKIILYNARVQAREQLAMAA